MKKLAIFYKFTVWTGRIAYLYFNYKEYQYLCTSIILAIFFKKVTLTPGNDWATRYQVLGRAGEVEVAEEDRQHRLDGPAVQTRTGFPVTLIRRGPIL
jgi:hypothetical protein